MSNLPDNDDVTDFEPLPKVGGDEELGTLDPPAWVLENDDIKVEDGEGIDFDLASLLGNDVLGEKKSVVGDDAVGLVEGMGGFFGGEEEKESLLEGSEPLDKRAFLHEDKDFGTFRGIELSDVTQQEAFGLEGDIDLELPTDDEPISLDGAVPQVEDDSLEASLLATMDLSEPSRRSFGDVSENAKVRWLLRGRFDALHAPARGEILVRVTDGRAIFEATESNVFEAEHWNHRFLDALVDEQVVSLSTDHTEAAIVGTRFSGVFRETDAGHLEELVGPEVVSGPPEILCDRTGVLWVLAGGALFRVDSSSSTTLVGPLLPDAVSAIALCGDGVVALCKGGGPFSAGASLFFCDDGVRWSRHPAEVKVGDSSALLQLANHLIVASETAVAIPVAKGTSFGIPELTGDVLLCEGRDHLGREGFYAAHHEPVNDRLVVRFFTIENGAVNSVLLLDEASHESADVDGNHRPLTIAAARDGGAWILVSGGVVWLGHSPAESESE